MPISRSSGEIESEAAKIGKMLSRGELADNSTLQVLCALVEELADNVDRIERELQALKRGSA